MKIAIYGREGMSHSADELEELVGALSVAGVDYSVNAAFADVMRSVAGIEIPAEKVYCGAGDLPCDIQMLVSYGGDGTFLDSVRLLEERQVPILGVNSGRLGFLANVSKRDIREALAEVTYEGFAVEERSMLRIEGGMIAEIGFPCAFNEFSIQKSGVTMLSVDVFIDGEYVTTYLGDGIILSTPTGSTAYSLSVGGAIVAPRCRCLVLSPIASHNLTMRPLVLPDTSSLTFKIKSREGKAFATLDNRHMEVEDGSSFTVTIAEKPVLFAKLRNNSFYKTLRDKMMWGVDSREGVK